MANSNEYMREYGKEYRRGERRTHLKVRAHTLPTRYIRIILFMYKREGPTKIREIAQKFNLNQDTAEVYIYNMQRELGGLIQSRKHYGYWLSDSAKEKIRKVLKGEE